MVHGKKKHQRRTKYFIHKRFQLQYLGLFLVLSIFIMVMASATVYISTYDVLKEKLESVYPQSELRPIIRQTNWVLFRNLILLIPIIAVGSVYLSHKIAGPLYRIEKSIEQIAKGDLDLKVKLRQGDEFKEIAHALNHMTEKLKGMRMRDLAVIEDIKTSTRKFLASVENSKDSTDLKRFKDVFEKEVKELEDIISKNYGEG